MTEKIISEFQKTPKKQRMKFFEDNFLDIISMEIDVGYHQNGGFSIFHDELGTIDYYPKADKVLIRKDNRWINNGLDFIIDLLDM